MRSNVSINFLQKYEDALIPQPLLPSLGEGEPDFKVPLPNMGEGFRVRAGTFARGLILTRGFGLSLLVGLVGCSSPALQPEETSFHPEAMLSTFDFSTAKISDLQKQKTNFTVHLQGKTGAQAPLAGLSAYELQDRTGKIWVVAKSASPAPGTEVKVTGKVRYQSIVLDGRDQGSLYVEQEGAAEPVPANKS